MRNYGRSSDTGGNLERLRVQLGSDKLRAEYLKMARENRKKAVSLINSETLRFSTLYILSHEIVISGLLDELTPRNRMALLLCANVDSGIELPAGKELPENDEAHAALRWVLLSGHQDNGLCNDFDQALDAAVILLIRIYHDPEVLPEIVRLIFQRNRKGQYIHDLIWALFGSHDPQILSIIAEYLRSSNKRDVELANKLLKHASDNWTESVASGRRYAECSSWLRENRPYLNFTEESFHQSSEPVLYRVDLEAKYLCRKSSAQVKMAMAAQPQDSSDRLESFRRLPGEQKAMLAKYSNRLYGNNRRRWSQWMEYPIEKQIKIAGGRSGGYQ